MMELQTGVLYIVMIVFAGIFSYVIFKKYTSLELEKHSLQHHKETSAKVSELAAENEKIKHANSQLRYRLRHEYDLDLEDLDIDENADDATKVSDIVSAIFPQLPKKLTTLADRSDIQELVANIAAKNPDKLSDFISNFTKSKDQTNIQQEPYGI